MLIFEHRFYVFQGGIPPGRRGGRRLYKNAPHGTSKHLLVKYF
jgi:hypothetical protein